MRSMETLIDANHALSKDLPLSYLRRQHWLEAGNMLVEAATTGDDADRDLATERLFYAIEHEGWMERPVLIPEASSSSGDGVPQQYIPRRRRLVESLPEKFQEKFRERFQENFQESFQPSFHAKLEPFFRPRLRLLEGTVVESTVADKRPLLASAR
jgi:hypothetical protein